MIRLPHILAFLVAVVLVAADEKKPSLSPEQIQTWVKQLGDDDYKVREEATRDLIKAEGAAFDAVRKATKSDDAEVRQRAFMIVKLPEKAYQKQMQKVAVLFSRKHYSFCLTHQLIKKIEESRNLQKELDVAFVRLNKLKQQVIAAGGEVKLTDPQKGIIIYQIRADVFFGIKKAREQMTDDPRAVEEQMKVLKDMVLAVGELPPEIHTQLVARIDAVIRHARKLSKDIIGLEKLK